jgi:MATE family multidrug resistance protein
MFFSYGIDGFAYAAESLVGALKGARDNAGLKKMIQLVFRWGFGLGLVGSALFYIGEDAILHLFTDDNPTITKANELYMWMVLAPAIGSFCYIWDGIYVGLTASAEMRNSMLIAVLGVFFPIYFIGAGFIGVHALWLAMLGFLAARALGQWAFARFYLSLS